MDQTEELDEEQASFYQSQIGVLRWIVELGRVDIIVEVSMLSSHVAMSREGHLDALLHVFGYLSNRHNARMVFDPTYPVVDANAFRDENWDNYYGDAKEPILPDAPPALGKDVDIRMFVDSDHAGERRTRRSRTGFIIYINMAPVTWFSKRQATVETSVFGAEFVAIKQGMEALRGLRYKLRMMGVNISGPSMVYGDNMSVIYSTSRPESTLKKKSNLVCYHAVRESVAMKEMVTAHVPSITNPSDLCTKVMTGGQKRDGLVGMVLYDICDEHSPDG